MSRRGAELLAMGLSLIGSLDFPMRHNVWGGTTKVRAKQYKLTRAQWKKRKAKLRMQRKSRKSNR